MDEAKALSTLAALCAKAEYCTGDMDDKMRGGDSTKRPVNG